MVGFYNYTVYLTYFSLISAFFGIFFSFNCNLKAAVICLIVSGVCDMFDGKIARTKKDRTTAEKRFGIQIDSLCDAVCFGVFPAVLGIAVGASRFWQLAVAALFAVCGVIRLAYFNVLEEERQSNSEAKVSGYLGVPITTSALVFPVLMCFQKMIGDGFDIVYTILLAVVGFCYIAPIHVKKPGKLACVVMLLIGVAVIICIIKM